MATFRNPRSHPAAGPRRRIASRSSSSWVPYEFPWLTRKALEFALFRSFGAPSISKILDRTGQFRDHGQRRFDDTALLIAELVENGYDSPRGRQAIRMMNRFHRPHHIRNGDMLYVLSTFIFEPILWIDKYGWRKLLPTGKDWRTSISGGKWASAWPSKTSPETLEAFAHFQQEYERENYGYHPANRRVAEATIAVMQDWYPRLPYQGARWAFYSLLNDTLRRAFDFPKAPAPDFLGAPWESHTGGKERALPAPLAADPICTLSKSTAVILMVMKWRNWARSEAGELRLKSVLHDR